jgi:Holliday junction resolvase RusA-like endonuclease
MKIVFEVPGPILGWQRVERDRRSGRVFNSAEQAAYQTMVGTMGKIAAMKAGFRGRLLTGPLGLSVNVWYERPKRSKDDQFYKTSKPDLSNIIKNIEDSLNKVVWQDDAKVALYGQSGKYYTINGTTHAVVEVWELRDGGG